MISLILIFRQIDVQCLTSSQTNFTKEKSSNKLRMKALVGWITLYQVSELINLIVFVTRIKNDMDKDKTIISKCNF